VETFPLTSRDFGGSVHMRFSMHYHSILGFRRVLASAALEVDMNPQCAILPSPYCCELHSWLLPNSQSSITSWKSGHI